MLMDRKGFFAIAIHLMLHGLIIFEFSLFWVLEAFDGSFCKWHIGAINMHPKHCQDPQRQLPLDERQKKVKNYDENPKLTSLFIHFIQHWDIRESSVLSYWKSSNIFFTFAQDVGHKTVFFSTISSWIINTDRIKSKQEDLGGFLMNWGIKFLAVAVDISVCHVFI